MSDYHIGISGLNAAQQGLNIVGNNIANAATEGYHRQRVELRPADGVQLGGFMIGGGVEVVGETPGEAATMKLLRSIVTKGLTAATLESMEAASRFGLEDWLWDHVGEFLETADRRTIERLVVGTRPHVNRRIVEMGSAAAFLESVSIQPLTARATEALLKNVRDGEMPATDRLFHEK